MATDYRADARYAHLSLLQVRKHYEVERELRESLLASLPTERTATFLWAYEELFRRVPWHPALTERSGADAPERAESRAGSLIPFLGCPPGTRVLEIGCGMGELMLGLAHRGYNCTGVDVSETRIERLQPHESANLRFEKVEGTHLPFADDHFDAVISMQLFEHLHPDDALGHLSEVRRVLKPGGRCLIETPNRLVGPGDVSRFFSDEPQGFHLREYSIGEMVELFTQAGFAETSVVLWRNRCLPAWKAKWLERCWGLLPKTMRRKRTLGLHNPLYLAEKPRL